jgi:ribonuclease P protein component
MPEHPTRRRLRLPRASRLCDSAAFDRLLKQGARVSDGLMSLWARRNGLVHTRFGMIVSRKHGNAVIRNRIRRRLREAFRLARARLPAGLDLASGPHVGANITVAGTIESLLRLAERLARRLEAS